MEAQGTKALSIQVGRACGSMTAALSRNSAKVKLGLRNAALGTYLEVQGSDTVNGRSPE